MQPACNLFLTWKTTSLYYQCKVNVFRLTFIADLWFCTLSLLAGNDLCPLPICLWAHRALGTCPTGYSGPSFSSTSSSSWCSWILSQLSFSSFSHFFSGTRPLAHHPVGALTSLWHSSILLSCIPDLMAMGTRVVSSPYIVGSRKPNMLNSAIILYPVTHISLGPALGNFRVASSPSTAFTWYVLVSTSLLCSSQES